MSRHGFTLIELLVVMSVVSLLVALLLPALTKAREAAQLVQCQSGLRQIGTGLAMYHQSHGPRSTLPISKHPSSIMHPLMYANPSSPLSGAFELFAYEYLSVEGVNHSKNWEAGTRGVLECPARRYDNPLRAHTVENSYLASHFIGGWAGLRYGNDAGGGIPQTRLGLTVDQNIEGFSIFGFRGRLTWNNAAGIAQYDRVGVYLNDMKRPAAWPIFFDQLVADPGTNANFVDVARSNHPATFNVLYLDWSVQNQRPIQEWYGDSYPSKSTQWPKWYFPVVKFPNFTYYP